MRQHLSYRFPFATYPAVRIALLIAAGIMAGALTGVSTILPVSIFGSCCVALIWSEIQFQRTLNPIFYRISASCYLAMLFLFGMGWHCMRTGTSNGARPISNILQAFIWEQAEFRGSIYNIKETGSGKFQIDLAADTTIFGDSLYWIEGYNLRAILDTADNTLPPNLKLGNRIRTLATVYPLEEKRNPHEFDYKGYLASQHIFAQAGIDSVLSISAARKILSWAAFRQQVLDLIEINFSPLARPLAKALLIGFKNELGREEKIAFSRVGLSHIMAVSGLHVGFIIAPFWIIIPWFWTLKYGKQAGLVLLVILLVGYAGLTGFSASVSRAALTGGFITYGKLFHKIRDSINLTAVSAIILLIINPDQLFDAGFQLSFSAVYVILLTMPVLTRLLPVRLRYRWYGKLLMVVLVSLVVQAGLFPLLAYHFGEFSLIGPLANAFVVPALGIVVPFALVLLPVSAFAPKAGFILNLPNEWFLTLLNRFVQFTSGLEGSWIRVHLESPVIFLVWIAGVLLIASLSVPALRWKMLTLLLTLLTLHSGIRLANSFKAAPLTVTVFDVGQGDAALVSTPGGKHFLIDAGRWTPGYNSARYVLIPHLRAEGIDRLDALFLSHPHADHIGGIMELINEIPIDTIYNSGYEYDSNLYRRYRDLANRKSVPVRPLTAGSQVMLDETMKIFVYGPEKGYFGDDPNEHSLILELVYGDTEFLFVGDAGHIQEQRVVKNFGSLLDTDFLKVGHHGSRTSSSTDFLALATPDIAVVSLAKSNRFRHPHPEAILRLRHDSDKIFFTSLHKALIFTSDGGKIGQIEW